MATVTSDNHGPLLNVAMWIVLVPMIITVLTKAYTKSKIIRKIQPDDYLGLIATVYIYILIWFLAKVLFMLWAYHAPLTLVFIDSSMHTILPSELNRFYIAQYVGHIMYILAIFVTKLSSLSFFICLTGEGSAKRRVVRGSIRAFWIVNAVADALTQVFIGLLPIYILSGLKMKKSKKRLTMLMFSPNLLTLPLLILRMVYLYQAIYSSNYTWNSFNLALVTNLHTSFAIMLSCIPFSKSIIDSLVLAPHVITDTARGTVLRYRPNHSGRENRSNAGGSSNFLGGVTGRMTTFETLPEVEAQELNEYLNRAESQERMISEPTSPATSKAELIKNETLY
ncbi:hypothetical protein NHQ30_002486 [Ciborinia camelliae]|nr:hypothetical protein NHQ30_002486 [Ciborinia camelliae]